MNPINPELWSLEVLRRKAADRIGHQRSRRQTRKELNGLSEQKATEKKDKRCMTRGIEMHTYIHAYIHTQIDRQTDSRTDGQADRHTHTHTYIYIYIYTHSHAHKHANTRSATRTCTDRHVVEQSALLSKLWPPAPSAALASSGWR